MTVTSRFPWAVVLFWYKWHEIDLGVDFTIFEAEELENDEFIHVELVRDLESDCDVTISVTCRISSNINDTRWILVSILPYFEAEEPKNYEMIYEELPRDSESDTEVTISVTCRISSNTNATNSILMPILPYSRLRNSNIRKEMTSHSRVT